MGKRLFDLTLGCLALLFLGPILITIACLVKASSPGPVFYRGVRVGRFGKPFRIFKFRSMVVDAERLGGSSTANGDARITAVGGWLRKYKLDELPQLLNVVAGQMSFVGPRPEVSEYVDMYQGDELHLLELRPGITDWASIWNSDEGAVLSQYPDPDEAYLTVIRPTKLKLQLLYARQASVSVDCKIIACTLWKLFHKSWLPAELREFGYLVPPKPVRSLAA